jgi:NADH-quinone oxidoreductase subunit L
VTVGLVPLLPLLGAAALLTFRRPLRRIAGYFATSTVGASFVLALMAFGDLLDLESGDRLLVREAYEWLSLPGLSIPVEFRIDPLSVVMILVVTGVGALIHAYSIGYMAGDDRQDTYFAFLNLFVFSMLLLVLANNFLVLYVGWELVGLCSYLLISFWHFKPSAAAAGKKAFIVNRIGDVGFLIGILFIYRTFGTLDFDAVFASVEGAPLTGAIAHAIPLLLFVGAIGKSAQIPLHVWLPDAMEGPTPVSALIHAATMVTAGVYMVARTHVIFEASKAAAGLVVGIGIVTAFFAATIATAQDDIKRVLAYSTISQLGFMFLAVGIGAVTGSPLAYAAGIFHLITHAFFKALLFLGAGSVMHGTGGETDMKRMGGLLKVLPVTGGTFMVGWLAIAGIPPLSGFFSKDAILAVTWEGGQAAAWLLALAAAGLTAFYMSRQFFLTFLGPSRLAEDVHPHEAPAFMTLPLRVLAVGAATAGLLGLSLEGGAITRFLEPVFGEGRARLGEAPFHIPEPLLAAIAVAVGLVGIGLAFRLYLQREADERREALKARLGWLVTLVRNKYYVDEVYATLIVWPGKTLANLVAYGFDVRVIDGAVNGVGALVGRAAVGMRRVQTGLVRRYVMAMLVGTVVILALFVARLQ